MNRLNYIYIIIFNCLLFTAAGCTDEFEPEQPNDDILLPGEYKFILSNDIPQSRVSYDDEIHSSFETGDRIGVFATNSERQIQNDVFSARNMSSNELIQVLAPPKGNVTQELDTEIPDPSSQNPPPNYFFYFPMNETWKLSNITGGTGLSYSVEADQTTKENFQKSDFLWNYLTPDPDAKFQLVNMHHLMANIIVKIHKDSIDISDDPTTGKPKGVTLHNMSLTAAGIYLARQISGEMKYLTNTNIKTDIKMYCQGTSGDYLIYRAAVPAWITKSADEPIFTATLFDRNGNPEEVTYKLADNLTLKDGYYYTFTLRSATKPPIEDVGDDDSWVLDVYSPDGTRIGLLCREYIYYCPTDEYYNSYDDANKNWPSSNSVIITTDPGNTYHTKFGDVTFPFCVNSQGWVFYNLQDNGIYPELSKGRVLRMIYDLGCIGGLPGYTKYKLDSNINLSTSNGTYSNSVTSWPAPHTNTAGLQGIFLMRHGHEWQTHNASGESSPYNPGITSLEYYMHGAEIIWDPSTNRIAQFNMTDYEGNALAITNNEAYYNGHIAMPTEKSIGINGQTKPYVSYDPFDENGVDEAGALVCTTVPHFISNVQKDATYTYPIVKIGFNKFWMSKSLRSKSPNRQTEEIQSFVRYNADGKVRETIFEAVGSDSPDKYPDYHGNVILPPGYVYPGGEGDTDVDDNGNKLQFDAWNSMTEEERNVNPIGLLYNSVVFKIGVLLPNDNDPTYDVSFITFDDIKNLRIYVGALFSAKLMSNSIRTQNGYSTYSESFHDAMCHNKLFHSGLQSFTPNISGLNLRPGGIIETNSNKPSQMGDQFAIFIDNGRNNHIDGFSIFSFYYYDGWGTKTLDNYFLNHKFYNTFSDESSASRLFAQVRCVYSYKNQSTTVPVTKSFSRSFIPREKKRMQKLVLYKSKSESEK